VRVRVAVVGGSQEKRKRAGAGMVGGGLSRAYGALQPPLSTFSSNQQKKARRAFLQ
jgi:hypothetical protein